MGHNAYNRDFLDNQGVFFLNHGKKEQGKN